MEIKLFKPYANCSHFSFAEISENVPGIVENSKLFDSLTEHHRFPYIYLTGMCGFDLDTVFNLEWNITSIKKLIPTSLFKELNIPLKVGGNENFIFSELSFVNLGQHGNKMECRVHFKETKEAKDIENIKSFIDIVYLYFAVQNILPKLSEPQEDNLFNMLISSDPATAELGVKILNRHNCLNVIVRLFLYMRYIKPWKELSLPEIRNKKEILWMVKGLSLENGTTLTYISDILGEECRSVVANEFIKLALSIDGISTNFKVKIEK